MGIPAVSKSSVKASACNSVCTHCFEFSGRKVSILLSTGSGEMLGGESGTVSLCSQLLLWPRGIPSMLALAYSTGGGGGGET